MIPAIRAEGRRLLSVRSTAVFASLLIGCCFGPIIVMGLIYDPAYRGPIDAGDLGKCASIFHVVAVVFTGTYTATEIRSGSPAISFLTQRHRVASLAAQYSVTSSFLILTYVVGMGLALVAALFYPDGLAISGRGWTYLALYGVLTLLWSVMATSLAVITRSVVAAVAVPITWMLLIEQLVNVIPMLEAITPWLPFTAGHSILNWALGESGAHDTTVVAVVAVFAPVVALMGAAWALHVSRDAP